MPALREDDRRRLPQVRLRGRDRPLGGVRRGADAATCCRRPRRGARETGDLSRPVLPRPLRRQGRTSRASCSTRFGARRRQEPVRNRDNPFCCGAGGGLLFADKEEEPGTRISDVRFKQLQDTGAGTVVTACPFCSIMLKGAQASAPRRRERPVRRPDDLRQRPAVTSVRDATPPTGGRRALKRLEAAAISAVGYRARRGARRDAPLAHRRARALRRDRRGAAASRSWRSGTAASCRPRIYFRRRGIVVITSENFDGEWIAGIIERFGYGTARGSTSRGGRRALLQLTRDMAAGQAGGVHGRRPARSGPRRAAGRGLARQGHRQPGPAVSPRSRPVTGR